MSDLFLNFELFFSLVWKVLWGTIKVFSPILIVYFLFFFGKMIRRYYLYGYKDFHLFKKRKKGNQHQELFFFMLDKLEGTRKIMVIPGLSCKLLMIDATGVYLFYDIEYQGVIRGRVQDEALMEQTGLKKVHPLPNFLHQVQADVELLKDKCLPFPVFPWLVISNLSTYQAEVLPAMKVVKMKDFFDQIHHIAKTGKRIYSKEQITALFQVLKKGD